VVVLKDFDLIMMKRSGLKSGLALKHRKWVIRFRPALEQSFG